MTQKFPMESILFCCQCFASSENASWNGAVFSEYCANCGSNGTVCPIPRHLVDSIREQASWVGKRYYPGKEDKEVNDELIRLRAAAPPSFGRSVESALSHGGWTAIQKLPDNSTISILISESDAPTMAAAFEYAKTRLPWFPFPEKVKKPDCVLELDDESRSFPYPEPEWQWRQFNPFYPQPCRWFCLNKEGVTFPTDPEHAEIFKDDQQIQILWKGKMAGTLIARRIP